MNIIRAILKEWKFFITIGTLLYGIFCVENAILLNADMVDFVKEELFDLKKTVDSIEITLSHQNIESELQSIQEAILSINP